ncbi:MAG TPA: citramalate synthase [Candidatus Nanoarchaeia archaeon]|nr:citramalate synthase [Candidatus Nanoarchaeia archaeon]
MIKLFDTTLRDGTQSADVNLTVRDKLDIARALDELGIDYLEMGWPGSNPKEMEAFLEASKVKLKKAKIVAFGSTRRVNLTAEQDPNLIAIVESKAPVACIFGKTWLQHVERQLKTKGEDNLKAIADSIKFLKGSNLEVIYDLEHFFDGFKDNKEYALKCVETAADAGADCIVMCDTNGGSLPGDVAEAARAVQALLQGKKICIGVHTHNDAGFALANAMAALPFGVTHFQGTINGIGERVGNMDLCQLVATLALKKNLKLDVKLLKLKEVSDLVYTLANLKPNPNQPYLGKNAFSHKGGVHVDAVMKGASYEHVDPTVVGNKRDIVLSDLSGKANIVEVLKKFGVTADKNDSRVAEMLSAVERLEHAGYDIGNLNAEKALLVEKYFGNKDNSLKIDTWKVSSQQKEGEYSESTITGSVDGKKCTGTSAVQGGPVDALYKALQHMLSSQHKRIDEVKLINYKVRIALDKGAESSVRVYIEFKNGKQEWGTVGVSTNILEASLEAIEKGFKYYLIKKTI